VLRGAKQVFAQHNLLRISAALAHHLNYKWGCAFMKSLVIKRSVVVAGRKTSVSLEDAFWKGLKEVAGEHDTTLGKLVDTIDCEREYGNLSSALRLSELKGVNFRV